MRKRTTDEKKADMDAFLESAEGKSSRQFTVEMVRGAVDYYKHKHHLTVYVAGDTLENPNPLFTTQLGGLEAPEKKYYTYLSLYLSKQLPSQKFQSAVDLYRVYFLKKIEKILQPFLMPDKKTIRNDLTEEDI